MNVEDYVERNWERLLEELKAFVRIPSVSTDRRHRSDIDAAAGWVAGAVRAVGPFQVRVIETSGHPVVYAEWLEAPDAPTVLVYGHYDVQPPDPMEAWQSAPFEPDIRDGRLFARGVSDDKGPMYIAVKAAEALFADTGTLPLNVKLLFEGEEEIGSPSLEGFITEHRELLAADFALSADGAMWQPGLPSITTGSRGLVALNLRLQGPAKDLHSGRHGGAVQNPLHALVELLASLHGVDGSVAVRGFYEDVVPISAQERADMSALRFDEEAYRRDVGVTELWGEAGYSTLERQWSRPTLEVNGLGGGYAGEGSKTVIPASAFAKITCRLVPDQDPTAIAQAVQRHLRDHTPTGTRLTVDILPGSARAYRIAPDHAGLQTARTVLRAVYDREPVAVLIGGTLPVSEIFSRVLGIDTVFFSFSTADEDFHAPNEFFRLARYREGIAAWVRFWETASRVPKAGGRAALHGAD